MPEPHLNTFNAIGRMLVDGSLDYLGANRSIPRCRFTLVQARPHKLERATKGYETIVLPCELFGRYAEVFCSIAGQDSWVVIEGRMRSYNMNGRYPQLRIVVRRWSILEAVLPGRGYNRRTENPNLGAVAGLPGDGEQDET